jgi:hypothetical protein
MSGYATYRELPQAPGFYANGSALVPPVENETEDESEAAGTKNKQVSNRKSNPANYNETKRNERTHLRISNGHSAE